MKAKKILVTGGTGFLGSALVKKLAQTHQVRVFDNDSRGDRGRLQELGDKIEFVNADIRDAAAVRDACEGVDVVFHLAFINGTEFFYSKPDLVLDVGVTGMLNIVKGSIEKKVPEFFLASSSEVYQTPEKIPTDESAALSIPDPLNPRYSYGGGKLISELLAINFGRNNFKRLVIFRPHNVYGPEMGWEHVIPQFIKRMHELDSIEFPIQGDGSETRAFVYIDDFTNGLQTLFERGEHMNIYHIGSQEEVSIRDLAQLIAGSLKQKMKIVPGALQKGSTRRRCPDISKIRRLGYEPKIKLAEGVEKTAQWYIGNLRGRKT